ncbi:hypothetical protein A33Q_1505 [Indibacter alkaliphilus LW1]|uniref:DUF6089 domain-containing protein n=1 Tax=Indibacter alkaliphilus (strain CCUG 57479 / KCTC 22604 / LW1) TaxID=1189612 RepID=S2E6V5_INDAL|nr:DUF6089 family protein [Indibacter alkaliphilus]EOZ97998.1 hypothetical protein A33Q_1505 [Indibacter alkaliphilus LW1]
MKKIKFLISTFLLILLGSVVTLKTKAQQYELGGGLGIAAYSGDIVRRLDQGKIGLQGTLFGRRNFDNVWSLRAGLSYGRITAADSITRIDPAAVYRDAGFKGNIWEASAVMEYHFLDFTHPQAYFRFSPYGFFGLGVSYYSAEGQSFAGDPEAGNYSLATPVIPFGAGIKYRLTDRWTLAAELGFRATFTDLLDKIDGSQPSIPRYQDVNNPSQPFGNNTGNYSDKDWYYFLGLTISYSFSSVKCYAY